MYPDAEVTFEQRKVGSGNYENPGDAFGRLQERDGFYWFLRERQYQRTTELRRALPVSGRGGLAISRRLAFREGVYYRELNL
jgi:hypothetical protein